MTNHHNPELDHIELGERVVRYYNYRTVYHPMFSHPMGHNTRESK